MLHITYTHMHQEQIPARNPTRIQSNPGVVIRGIGGKKPVWHNEEIQTPPQNRKIRLLYVSAYLGMHLWSEPTLDTSGKKYVILQRQLRR